MRSPYIALLLRNMDIYEQLVQRTVGRGSRSSRTGALGGRQRRRMREGRISHPPFPLQLRQLRCVVRHGGAPDLSQRPRLRPPC